MKKVKKTQNYGYIKCQSRNIYFEFLIKFLKLTFLYLRKNFVLFLKESVKQQKISFTENKKKPKTVVKTSQTLSLFIQSDERKCFLQTKLFTKTNLHRVFQQEGHAKSAMPSQNPHPIQTMSYISTNQNSKKPSEICATKSFFSNWPLKSSQFLKNVIVLCCFIQSICSSPLQNSGRFFHNKFLLIRIKNKILSLLKKTTIIILIIPIPETIMNRMRFEILITLVANSLVYTLLYLRFIFTFHEVFTSYIKPFLKNKFIQQN